MTFVDEQEATRLWNKGRDTFEIAEKLGLSEGAVYEFITTHVLRKGRGWRAVLKLASKASA